MTTLSSGAVGFAPVGTFVKDLALELGKAPATLVAYLKKHLPATLTKRKNANNRLANFVTEDGVAGLRAHYTPTSAPAEVDGELQRLREENARLRARVQELEEQLQQQPTEQVKRKSTIPDTRFSFPEPTVADKLEEECERLFEDNRRITNDIQRSIRAITGRDRDTTPRNGRVVEFKRKSKE